MPFGFFAATMVLLFGVLYLRAEIPRLGACIAENAGAWRRHRNHAWFFLFFFLAAAPLIRWVVESLVRHGAMRRSPAPLLAVHLAIAGYVVVSTILSMAWNGRRNKDFHAGPLAKNWLFATALFAASGILLLVANLVR